MHKLARATSLILIALAILISGTMLPLMQVSAAGWTGNPAESYFDSSGQYKLPDDWYQQLIDAGNSDLALNTTKLQMNNCYYDSGYKAAVMLVFPDGSTPAKIEFRKDPTDATKNQLLVEGVIKFYYPNYGTMTYGNTPSTPHICDSSSFTLYGKDSGHQTPLMRGATFNPSWTGATYDQMPDPEEDDDPGGWFGSIVGVINDVLDFLTDWATDVGNFLSDILSAISTGLIDLATDIGNGLTALGTAIVDGLTVIGNFIVDGISALFLPDDGYWSEWFTDLQAFFSEKLGFLVWPFGFLADFFGAFLGGTTQCYYDVSGSFFGGTVSADFCALEDNLPTMFTLIVTFVRAFTVLGMIFAIYRKYQSTLQS